MFSCLQLKIPRFLEKGIYCNFNGCLHLLFSMGSSAFLPKTSFRSGELKKNTWGRGTPKGNVQAEKGEPPRWEDTLLTLSSTANALRGLHQGRQSEASDLTLTPAELTASNLMHFVPGAVRTGTIPQERRRRGQSWICPAGWPGPCIPRGSVFLVVRTPVVCPEPCYLFTTLPGPCWGPNLQG